ncbi:MAG: hypothetical protein ACTHZD_06390 [Micrococcaceae bacterium]
MQGTDPLGELLVRAVDHGAGHHGADRQARDGRLGEAELDRPARELLARRRVDDPPEPT